MEEKKDNRGGARNNSGRKKLGNGEKKVQIKFWVENKYTFPFGGIEKAKNFALEAVKNGNNPVMERNIQDLNQPTNQIKPITEQKESFIGNAGIMHPTPLISPYNDFRLELKECKTISQIEAVMARVKSEPMLPRDKMSLEAYAKELSKDMFND